MDWKSLGGVKYRAHYICDEWVCSFCFLWNMVYVKTWNLTWNSFVSYRGSKKSCYKIQTDLKFQSSVISSSSRMSWPYLQSKYCLSILLFITIKTYDFEFSDVSHSACLEIKRQQCTNLNWAQVELLLTLHSQGGCERSWWWRDLETASWTILCDEEGLARVDTSPNKSANVKCEIESSFKWRQTSFDK